MITSYKEFNKILKSCNNLFKENLKEYYLHFNNDKLIIEAKSYPFKITQELYLNDFNGQLSIVVDSNEILEELKSCRSYSKPITFNVKDDHLLMEVNQKEYTVKYKKIANYINPADLKCTKAKGISYTFIDMLLNNIILRKDTPYLENCIDQTLMVNIQDGYLNMMTYDIVNLRFNSIKHKTYEVVNNNQTLYLKSEYLKQMYNILKELFATTYDICIFNVGVVLLGNGFNLTVMMDKANVNSKNEFNYDFKPLDNNLIDNSLADIQRDFEKDKIKINLSNVANYTAYLIDNTLMYGKDVRGNAWTNYPTVPFYALYSFLSNNNYKGLMSYQDDKQLLFKFEENNSIYITGLYKKERS